MRTLRFHEYGEPGQVLRLEEAAPPSSLPGHVRVRVRACGLNPADWALCQGFFPGDLPRGVGLDVAGVVDVTGDGVTDTKVGDAVLGAASFAEYPTAGASDFAILHHWTAVPKGLGFVEAAALPMAVETASRSLDVLGDMRGRTLLVYGAGTMMGFAAVQMALLRGAKVFAVAGETFRQRIEAMGAPVTSYGEDLPARVLALCGGAPELILETGPPSEVLPALLQVTGGDGGRIVTVANHGPAAEAKGVRNSFGPLRHDAFAEFAGLAAEGKFSVPVARTYPLTDWRDALADSLSWRAHGKLVLLPGD